jgi:hypothetical protein
MKTVRDFIGLPQPRRINPPRLVARLPPQGYRIAVRHGRVRVEAADAAGRFYARNTLTQMRRVFGRRLPTGVIEDWPDYPVRGVMLDISRDKVPTMETLFRLVDLFAEMKINHLQLYMEHTFAYRRHREVWSGASPMTAREVRALDAYCRERFIELVPNQNTFGHMHRWLKLPKYKRLAECPDGFVTPWKDRRPDPFSLNPTDPASFRLVRELLGELLPNFAGRMVNVGCDETWDLGQGRSKAACARRGNGRVYLDYLLKIHRLVTAGGRRMLFWGDIILKYPDLIPELPRDLVALVWGYEGNHPFDKECAAFERCGLEFWVCPGTSAWNSIAGRTDNALENIRSAARNGLKHGARGFLLTDWGDNGHWQPWAASYLGFAAGAAMSWCLRTNARLDWSRVLDAHVFRDETRRLGRAALDLGNAHRETGRLPFNASALFRLLHQNDIQPLLGEIAPGRLERCRARIARILKTIRASRPKAPDARLVQEEFILAARLLLHACDRGLGRPGAKLAGDLRGILRNYEEQWLARNRKGGLSDSTHRLRQRISEYEAASPRPA